MARRFAFSPTTTFHFETVRALWAAPFNGADYGEVAATVAWIKSGDFESWYRRWSGLADAVHTRAQRLTDSVSRGKALLRASGYARCAEFYLDPADPRRRERTAHIRDWFDHSLAMLGVDATRSTVPFDGGALETIFLRCPRPGARDVLVVHGGFDSIAEELYFTIGAGALERGYHVLIFDGPGQGRSLREHGLRFIPEWERPVAAVLDTLEARCDPGAVIGVGISFGGHLIARAASVEKRYDGIVLFDYFPGILEAFSHLAPGLVRRHVAGMPRWLQPLVRLMARVNPNLRWALRHARWTFGIDSLPELVAEMARYDERAWAGEITTDVLVLLGEAEHFFDPHLGHRFARRLTRARSVTVHEFPAAEGGGLHCQNGAAHLPHEVIFDWIATLPRRADAPPGLTTGALA